MNGDQFRAIFAEHREALYQFAWRMTGSAVTAEDIAHDVFMLLLRGDVQFDAARGSMRSLLLGVARHCAWKRWRHERLWSPLDEDDFIAAPLSVESLDEQQAVGQAVAALPPLQREVLLLATYEGMHLDEIASLLSIEVGTVKSRLHRARTNLKSVLAAYKPVTERREGRYGSAE